MPVDCAGGHNFHLVVKNNGQQPDWLWGTPSQWEAPSNGKIKRARRYTWHHTCTFMESSLITHRNSCTHINYSKAAFVQPARSMDHRDISNRLDSACAFGAAGADNSHVSSCSAFGILYVPKALRKLATKNFDLHVLIFRSSLYVPSSRDNLSPTEQIFIKSDIWAFFENLSWNSSFIKIWQE